MSRPPEPFPAAGASAEEGRGSQSLSSAGTHDVLMLGWEFPPFISGGLGTACYGLTKAMSRRGDRVLFILPEPHRIGFSAAVEAHPGARGAPAGVALPEFHNVQFQGVDVHPVDPYARSGPARPREQGTALRSPPHWEERSAQDILKESRNFTRRALELALEHRATGRHFDVVHAHDWMTFEAGATLARELGLPLIIHLHSTEHDRRAGEAPDGQIAAIERRGLQDADAIIAVSRYTAQQIARHYGVEGTSVVVVHNALDLDSRLAPQRPMQIGADERVVLFVGRLTQQKGPDVFVRAAQRVLEHLPAVRFVMAGSGEQFSRVRQLAQQLGVEQYFLFTGFLRSEDIDGLYRAADVLVMPSLSEPFGLVSLEAMARDVPVIVSRQSGAAEALEHVLKVDFWNVEELAGRIVSVLSDPTLARELSARGSFEVRQMRWSDAAEAVAQVYDRLLRNEVGG